MSVSRWRAPIAETKSDEEAPQAKPRAAKNGTAGAKAPASRSPKRRSATAAEVVGRSENVSRFMPSPCAGGLSPVCYPSSFTLSSIDVCFVSPLRMPQMKFHGSKLLLILAALMPMRTVGLAAPRPAQPAAWVAHDLSLDLHNLPLRYSCEDLQHKFHDVLLVLGARPDVKVLTARCELRSRSPSVRLQFATPELVERTSRSGLVIDAAAAIIRLEPGHPASLNEGDCELILQMKDRLLAPIARRVISFNLACSAPPSRGPRFTLSVQTLTPLDSGARVAEEHEFPPERLN